ncbi:hypothetical protein HNY73_014529 [Argiope bruennichi]|uniref:Uncharacterized protein n=1 Tax=Argiope bruennichi TaxID=94029 RepID=A0A8T0ER15_ARGBR|nr:hypothetical protein HNY73_014529 [Argiope bruennichi]
MLGEVLWSGHEYCSPSKHFRLIGETADTYLTRGLTSPGCFPPVWGGFYIVWFGDQGDSEWRVSQDFVKGLRSVIFFYRCA